PTLPANIAHSRWPVDVIPMVIGAILNSGTHCGSDCEFTGTDHIVYGFSHSDSYSNCHCDFPGSGQETCDVAHQECCSGSCTTAGTESGVAVGSCCPFPPNCD